MPSGTTRELPGDRKAFIYAVLVHLGLIALVVVGFRWQSKPPVAPARVVQAQAVNDTETRKEIERRRKLEREYQERERRMAEEKRRQEQAKIADQKRREEDKRKAVEAEKKHKEAVRQADIRKKKDAEERRKSAESSLKEQLAREEKQRGEDRAKAERLAQAQSELARIENLIRQKVERNWVRPAGWTKELECVMRVRLAPTGEVLSATIARPSGSPAFDRSVENAVYKASPLPLSEDKDLFEHFRELELRFRPEGQT